MSRYRSTSCKVMRVSVAVALLLSFLASFGTEFGGCTYVSGFLRQDTLIPRLHSKYVNTKKQLTHKRRFGRLTARVPTTGDVGTSSKCPVLICPAQLSVPADYRQMIVELNDRGFPAYGADLTRVGWVTGLLPSAFSPAYFKGDLTPDKTLKFYYQAIERTLDVIGLEHPEAPGIHVIGHSIGGWVARAWLAEHAPPAVRDNVISLTTLGTPNTSPREDAGPWTAIDQTRGLLKYINGNFPGAHVNGVRYSSVVGTALKGKIPGSLEEMLAFVSYLPLGGDGSAAGDGIIPRDIAILEGSNVVELPTCKHSGFVPFPGEAIDLGEHFLWYGSGNLIGRWADNLDRAEEESGASRERKGTRRLAWQWW